MNLENISWPVVVRKSRRKPEKSILKSVEANLKMLAYADVKRRKRTKESERRDNDALHSSVTTALYLANTHQPAPRQ